MITALTPSAFPRNSAVLLQLRWTRPGTLARSFGTGPIVEEVGKRGERTKTAFYLDGGYESGTRALPKVIQDSLPRLRGGATACDISRHRGGEVHALGDSQSKHPLHSSALLACTGPTFL